MNNSFAPIVIFTYLRLKKLKKIVDTLKKNKISKRSEIFFFSDNFKNIKDKKKVLKVRRYLKKVNGFKKKKIILRKKNYGNGKNIIEGASTVLKKNKSAIFLEDDLIINENFLTFMDLCLKKYSEEKKVWHVGAWNYDLNIKSKFDIFFSKNMNCWGWATWSDRWRYFEKKPNKILNYLNNNKNKIYEFNLNGKINYYNQIIRNKEKKINTWAVFWYAQIFKNKGLCISPNNSLVKYNGFDHYSIHSHPKHFMNTIYQTKINKKKKFNLPDKIIEYKKFSYEFENFYKKKINIKFKLKNLFNKIRNSLI